MIAAPSLYSWPETREARHAFWQAWRQALEDKGVAAPRNACDALPDEAAYERADLLVAQTCGYPFATCLAGKVQLVATPHYDVAGASGADYSSAVVVRRDAPAESLDALRGRTAAYNGTTSQSGYNALRRLIAPLADAGRFFASTTESGSHAASMQLVAAGDADCAAIDAVCWALARRHRPQLTNRLRVIAWSERVPGLPLVTAASAPAPLLEALRTALSEVLEDPHLAGVRAELMISGASVPGEDAYARCTAMEAEAAAMGYPRLV